MPGPTARVRYHRDLRVWQQAVELAAECYSIVRLLPAYERFGLSSQMQRAAVSVPSNIAEGNGRRSPRECVRFLLIAHGSLMELETHLYLAQRFGYVNAAELSRAMELRTDVGRMLGGLVKRLRAEPQSTRR